MSTQYQSIGVTPVEPALGAEISGIDLAAGVSHEQFAEIRQAFIDHGVIFFRDQHITSEQHIAFAEMWGEINVNRFFQPVDGYPRIAQVRKEPDQRLNIGSNWHTDHSYDQIPAMGSVLYARELPPIGGDTLFASMYAAYDALSDGMKATLGTMYAEHSSRHAFGQLATAPARTRTDLGTRLGNPEAALQDSVHPVVIEHPLSGRPSLYVNGDFTLRFQGWTDKESKPLLEYLYAHAVREEFTCRFRWEPGSMAVWDNRATQHRAVNDYQGRRRLMHRITIEGAALSPASTQVAA